MQAQLDKLQNSMATIDLHRNTIEGSMLDRTVLETLRASGDALKQMGATTGGIRAVEEIVADVEAQMESAAEITKIISTGSVSGMVNTMAIDGIVLDEDELMKELDLLEDLEQDSSINKRLNEAPYTTDAMILDKLLPPVPTAIGGNISSSSTIINSQQQSHNHAINPIPLPPPASSRRSQRMMLDLAS